jgi:ABC-type Fe3+-hydroxamate transport system substrate-binding protein
MILSSVNDLAVTPVSIISLVPSQTELLCYLGLDKKVTGITKFCIHPPEWKKTKIIVGGTKNIHTKIVKKISPDLIIANKEENEKIQIEELAKDYNVWLTDVNDLAAALQMIKDIGILTAAATKANQLVSSITTAFKTLPPLTKKIKTCYLIWQHPYIAVGTHTFINDMLIKCGFENIYSNKTRYPAIEIAALRNAGCELLILSSEPYPFKQKHADELKKQLPHTKIILADGEMFSWYGSRLLKAPDYFKKLIASF